MNYTVKNKTSFISGILFVLFLANTGLASIKVATETSTERTVTLILDLIESENQELKNIGDRLASIKKELEKDLLVSEAKKLKQEREDLNIRIMTLNKQARSKIDDFIFKHQTSTQLTHYFFLTLSSLLAAVGAFLAIDRGNLKALTLILVVIVSQFTNTPSRPYYQLIHNDTPNQVKQGASQFSGVYLG